MKNARARAEYHTLSLVGSFATIAGSRANAQPSEAEPFFGDLSNPFSFYGVRASAGWVVAGVYYLIGKLVADGISLGYTIRNVPFGVDASCPPNDHAIRLGDRFFDRPYYLSPPGSVGHLPTRSFLLMHVLARWAMYEKFGLCGSSSYDTYSSTIQRARFNSGLAVRDANSYAWFALSF